MSEKLINIPSGRIILSDPGRNCSKAFVAVPGVWKASVIFKTTSLGRSCINAGLELTSETSEKLSERLDIDKKLVKVETGIVGFFDYKRYLPPLSKSYTDNYKAFEDECDNAVNQPMGWGVVREGEGIVTLTGFGAGVFIATLFSNQDGELAKVSLDFVTDLDTTYSLDDIIP